MNISINLMVKLLVAAALAVIIGFIIQNQFAGGENFIAGILNFK